MKINCKKFFLRFTLIVLISSISFCMFGCNSSKEVPGQTNTPQETLEIPTQNDLITPTENNTTADNTDVTEEQDLVTQKPTDPDSTMPEPNTTIPTTNPVAPDNTENTSPVSPTQPSTDIPDASAEAYVNYHKMPGEEQQKFIDSFGSIEAFFTWLNTAKKAYEDNRTPIDGFTPIIP